MVNEEHLARLKQGVAAWNQWRRANDDIRPNLGQIKQTYQNRNKVWSNPFRTNL